MLKDSRQEAFWANKSYVELKKKKTYHPCRLTSSRWKKSRVGGVTLLRRVRALVLKRVSCGEEPNLWVTPSASRKAVFARLFVIVASWNRASITARPSGALSLARLMEAIRAKCSCSSRFTAIRHFLGLRLLCRRKDIILARAEHF